MTDREQEILKAYLIHKHYTQTSEAIGVSKQRVEQVVKKHRSTVPQVEEAYRAMKKPVDHSYESCFICHRSFSLISYGSEGMCSSCYNYKKRGRGRERTLFRDKQCSVCGVTYDWRVWRSRRTSGNWCASCFAKRPEVKEQRQRYWKTPEAREKNRIRMATYYHENRERLLPSMRDRTRKWQRANRNKLRITQSRYDLAKKLCHILILTRAYNN